MLGGPRSLGPQATVSLDSVQLSEAPGEKARLAPSTFATAPADSGRAQHLLRAPRQRPHLGADRLRRRRLFPHHPPAAAPAAGDRPLPGAPRESTLRRWLRAGLGANCGHVTRQFVTLPNFLVDLPSGVDVREPYSLSLRFAADLYVTDVRVSQP